MYILNLVGFFFGTFSSLNISYGVAIQFEMQVQKKEKR